MEVKKFQILIVDDEENNLALLYRTLRAKYDVDKAQSPVIAIDLLKQKHYDLIISDHKMPEMDGVELLKYAYDNCPDTMRILLTAYSEVGILINSINYAKIYRYIKKPYGPDELLMVVESALDYLQLKKDNEALISDLKNLFSGTIRAIVEALDAKDSFTVGRSKRVTYYSIKMAEYLSLPSVEVGKIEIAGMLHDIGMIGISDELLSKVEALTPEEMVQIKQHVHYSIKILEDIKQLKDVLEIIKHHHEHWNGNGYPDGLQGENIPLASRIIAITDAYDGMVSHRAYRTAKTHEQALAIIHSLSGVQFDPKLVDVFDAISLEALHDIEQITIYENNQV